MLQSAGEKINIKKGHLRRRSQGHVGIKYTQGVYNTE